MMFTLLAAQPADTSAAILVVIALALAAACGVAVVMFHRERTRRQEAEERSGFLLAQQHKRNDVTVERDDIMFTQHKQMNDLQIAKLTAEVELLQQQVKSKALDDDRIEASKEYHELMVEKSRLEIDSLRLHLMELRKRARTEDWREE